MTLGTRLSLCVTVLAAGVAALTFAQDQESSPAPGAGLGRIVQRIAPAKSESPAAGNPDRPAPHSRYRTLLKKLDVPEDQQRFGDFCDWGYWSGSQYAGQDHLPPGYWVYLAPKWYIFKEDVTGESVAPRPPRPWGPEQAVGAPDAWPRSGDLQTAWASKTPDGQREWLELSYDGPVRPAAVMVYETFNPGAVDRVTSFDAAGNEVELWSGSDPTPAGKEKGISVIPIQPAFDVTRIRIYLDSPKVAGWNEIDAVGLVDEQGTTHWAASARASSTYADVASDSTTQPVLELDVLSR